MLRCNNLFVDVQIYNFFLLLDYHYDFNMNQESYPFNFIDQIFVFEFESISPGKTIKKLVEISLVDYENQVFNIALVDVLPDNTLSDLTVSNNSDMPKVLATVFRALDQFFKFIPGAKVLLSGSTPSRTRLYQMAISKYLCELELKFNFWGFIGDKSENFTKGRNYERFTISLKQL